MRRIAPSPPSSISLPPSHVATAKKVVFIAFCVIESELANPENRELDSNSNQIWEIIDNTIRFVSFSWVRICFQIETIYYRFQVMLWVLGRTKTIPLFSNMRSEKAFWSFIVSGTFLGEYRTKCHLLVLGTCFFLLSSMRRIEWYILFCLLSLEIEQSSLF